MKAYRKRIIRLPIVEHITGIKRACIYKRMAEGTFPRQIKLGGNAVGWVESEILGWVDQQIDMTKENWEK